MKRTREIDIIIMQIKRYLRAIEKDSDDLHEGNKTGIILGLKEAINIIEDNIY